MVGRPTVQRPRPGRRGGAGGRPPPPAPRRAPHRHVAGGAVMRAETRPELRPAASLSFSLFPYFPRTGRVAHRGLISLLAVVVCNRRVCVLRAACGVLRAACCVRRPLPRQRALPARTPVLVLAPPRRSVIGSGGAACCTCPSRPLFARLGSARRQPALPALITDRSTIIRRGACAVCGVPCAVADAGQGAGSLLAAAFCLPWIRACQGSRRCC